MLNDHRSKDDNVKFVKREIRDDDDSSNYNSDDSTVDEQNED